MKKMIFAVTMAALSLTAFAQDYSATMSSVTVEASYNYISPLDLSATEFNLQALKDSSVNDQDYAAALNYLQTRLKSEKEIIAAAQKTLKAERSLYDAQMDLYKDRKDLTADMLKQIEANIKTYNGFLKTIDKQYGLIKKIENNTCDAIKAHSKDLDYLRHQFEDDIDRLRELKQRTERQSNEDLNQEFTKLNDFLIELTDKETRLTSLANQNKTNLDIVSGTLKTTEAALKAAAKAAKKAK